jgi:copper chaperone CopZ
LNGGALAVGCLPQGRFGIKLLKDIRMNTINLEVQGMSCGSCVKHVTQVLQELTGVSNVEVDLPSGRVRVRGELPQGSSPLASALTAAGYPARPINGSESVAPPKTSGCHAGNEGKGGCCCG